MRIAVLSDIHDNLPALEATLAFIRTTKCDRIFSIGDSIAIGPFPRETIQLLFDEGITLLMGNHEEYILNGFPAESFKNTTIGEIEHQKWVRKQLSNSMIKRLAISSYEERIEKENYRIRMLHFVYDQNGIIKRHSPLKNIDLESLFGTDDNLVIFGHTHVEMDVQLKTHYINPGALGCSKDSLARFITLDVNSDQLSVQRHQISYDKNILLDAFNTRGVPARDEIFQAFYGISNS
jgi:putative phosphoesterase